MNYRKAFENAVLFIEEHLDQPITVDQVADAAGYSYYHLSRQFSGILGESIGDYIRKRRLAGAAKLLIYTQKKILDIAFESGFESGEAFSRAFKTVYRVSPYAYRKNRLDLIVAAKESLVPDLLEHRIENITVHPVIRNIESVKVVGIRSETSLRKNTIPELWHRFHTLIDQVPHRSVGGRQFGICEACSEGNDLSMMNQDVMFSEVVGVEVSEFDELRSPFIHKVLPGGRYAVFTHRGSLARIEDTFNYIWSTWSFSTRETIDNREDFELYDERCLGYDHPDSEIDIYIPIR